MDEMDLVRAFRNEAREPDESSVRTARNALLERAGLGNHMAVVPTQPRRSHRHWAIPVVAVAVTGALAIVILIPVGRGSPSAAARVLIRASETAAEQRPLTVVGKGKYAYTKAEGMFAMSNQDFHIDGPVEDPLWAVLVPYTREVWVGADGSGRVVITHGDPEFLRPQDRVAWVATGSPDLRVPVSDETLGRGELHYFGPGGTTDLDVSTLPNRLS
jgi:hypothetical protein